MYLVTGATGRVGSIVAKDLLSKGKKVRIVGRHGIKMKDLINLGGEPLIGDLSHSRFVKKAFQEISAAFLILPPNYLSKDIRKFHMEIISNYVDAVRYNDVKHIVILSSVGAHIRNGCGIIDDLADMEKSFLEILEVNVLNLRAGYFMENLFAELNSIRDKGVISGTIDGKIKLPIIAAKDVATVAAQRLLALDFKGNRIEYALGPQDISFNEITSIIGDALNRPELKYVKASLKDYKNWLIKSGFVSENVAEAFIMMEEAFNSGWALSAHTRTRENSTPTTFYEFVKDIAYAYHHQKAA